MDRYKSIVTLVLIRNKLLLFILFIGQIWKNNHQVAGDFTCASMGKFSDKGNVNRYHQCFLLYGKLSYVWNICPAQTCFDTSKLYCTREACPGYRAVKVSVDVEEIAAGPSSYDCATVKKVRCKRKGLFAHPADHSVYIKCVKIWSNWEAICFTCNKKHKTCFSNTLQACIPHGKRCGKGKKTETSQHIIPDPPPPTTTYDCEGYSQYPCHALGNGRHGMPGDKSVYWYCSGSGRGTVGVCTVCPQESKREYFIERKDQCIINCGLGYIHKPYDCTTYKGPDNFECKQEGFFANPEDTSVFFNCIKPEDSSVMVAECFTCNSVKQTCYSEKNRACVTYKGENCPTIDVIDGPNEDNSVASIDNSLSFDCSGYNDYSFPCQVYQEETQFEHPGDVTVSMTCEKLGDGSWVAKCSACSAETNSCFDPKNEVCVRNCARKTPVPYDCSTYNETYFPCKESGFFANEIDTSVYFGCWLSQDGGSRSLCFTCNPSRKTCFDNAKKRCVTNPGRESCGTVDDLEDNNERGRVETTCEGYSSKAFPCFAYDEGSYALPGHPEVYVHCKSNEDGDEDSSDILSRYDSCHKCPRNGCYDDDKNQCIDNCGAGDDGENGGGATDMVIVTKEPGHKNNSGQIPAPPGTGGEAPPPPLEEIECPSIIGFQSACTAQITKHIFDENAYYFNSHKKKCHH